MIKGEILIVGAGIVGLTIAREFSMRGCRRIIVIDKEKHLGTHASGRNSGILHGGVYYTPDSLKAKSCLRGNRLLREFCLSKGLLIRETGKVIVAKKEKDLGCLSELYRRAALNGAKVSWLDEKELVEVEPAARTVGKALYVQDTASVDPKEILKALKKELEDSGNVTFKMGCCFKGIRNSTTASTSSGDIAFELFVNAAGAYSDKVAHAFGLAKSYRLIPFKGIYWKVRRDSSLVSHMRGNIYPAPDLNYPFLGVHFSKNVYGDVYVGPTAIPALGREHYGFIKGMDLEAPLILGRDGLLFLADRAFRRMALQEPLKYIKSFFFRDASLLVRSLKQEDLLPSAKAGIRPQLIDLKSKRLVMDFIVLKDAASMHVLNPISPAFTASMDLAEKVADMIA